MKEIFQTLKDNPLFVNIPYNEFEKMLNCLAVRTVRYKKNDIIILSGNTIEAIGLLLSGTAHITREEANGDLTLLVILDTSDLFGEILACAGVKHSPVTIRAAEDAEMLFIDIKSITDITKATCPGHKKLIENMVGIIARKAILLDQKIEILSKRTTREKLRCYFDIERGAAKKFTIPFTREELANYLCVNRSALSHELCNMRDEGLIAFHKNHFEIL